MADEQLAFDWGEEDAKRQAAGREPAAGGESPAAGMLPRAAALRARLGALAGRGAYLGTSSWKYPGWLGQVYAPQRYETRGKFSERKFNQECLSEYATVFPTVCGDFAFYQFPSAAMWDRLFSQVPAGYRFSLKVPEDVTVERFPDLARYGQRAGKENPHFMDAALVRDQLLARLEAYRDKLGVLIFEFGTIHRKPMSETKGFASALDHMLSRLPLDRYQFAVEVRNREFLGPESDYPACLRAHGVAHCFNSWTRMPPVHEQMRVPGAFTARHAVARFLLRPGRTYQQAVDAFAPYERVQDPYPEGRDALSELIQRCLPDGERTLFAFVNNRFEGSAVETIEAITRGLRVES